MKFVLLCYVSRTLIMLTTFHGNFPALHFNRMADAIYQIFSQLPFSQHYKECSAKLPTLTVTLFSKMWHFQNKLFPMILTRIHNVSLLCFNFGLSTSSYWGLLMWGTLFLMIRLLEQHCGYFQGPRTAGNLKKEANQEKLQTRNKRRVKTDKKVWMERTIQEFMKNERKWIKRTETKTWISRMIDERERESNESDWLK